MKKYDAIIVGSGPSGLICAQKLIDNGVDTLIVDFGAEIENEINQITLNLNKRDSIKWNIVQNLSIETEDKLMKKKFHEKYLYKTFYKRNFLKKNLLK